ncbi:LOW QUALITY PROTEIN: uncharacterized protein LOC115023772 [Cottoperca gobio]|uniref:LOW QUALITY PROTEIN: uncharacterized protein LOC115023772 n=1 Tax=Cottoperca gobio TaxID=56716 RepID=A0A6J2RNH0_COTGO|nr:LOW QUALITY PROTEIN: uncharacterized protein LOC115023772 [Cottoperca gobio]
MAFGICFGVTLLLSVWATAKCGDIPNEALLMECRDRFFMIAVDLSFAGNNPHFEAVDATGVYAITKRYAALCGYIVRVLPLPGIVELRASYFACHTDNKDDDMFTFNFNLIMMQEGKKSTHALKKTCSLSLPWSPREVTCEVNYMEVSVRSVVPCPSGTKETDWNSLKQVYTSATSDWQVMLRKDHGPTTPMMTPLNLSEAHEQGYAFHMTDGRLVFRAPYKQPHSYSTKGNSVPVEVVHAILFSRHGWVVLMVDLVAACSIHKGSYDDGGYMVWETPEALYPTIEDQRLNIALHGELVDQQVAEDQGYIVENLNATIQISIPLDAEGGYRKSRASGGLYEFYIFDLYLEQVFVNEDHMDTRLRVHRTLTTPLLSRPVSSENRTVPEERMFTVYLSDIPEDVELAAVNLNGKEFTVPFTSARGPTITQIVLPNNTHGYTLKVSFDDPVVMQQFSKEAAQHSLNINFTLMVWPENVPFYHLVSVMAFTDASPPAFDAVCSESGISFKLNHRPFDYLWEISIGSNLLTSELAAQHGYILTNNSKHLLLEVPLFSLGYEYKDVTLKGFFGTFEIFVREHETVESKNSTVKTCPFSTTELIICSTDGIMTVVADLSLASPSGGAPTGTNLVDKNCQPSDADSTRALFSFPLYRCGSRIKLVKDHVTYENEIFFSKKLNASNDIDRVTVQCTYPLAGLLSLFSVYKFKSDKAGVGRIVHSTQVLQSTGIKPATVVSTRRTQRPGSRLAARHPPARYIKVSSFQKPLPNKGVGQHIKVTPYVL